MGFILNKQDNSEVYGLKEFYADTLADVLNLPKDCIPGSTCMVKEGPELYVLTTDYQWEPYE